MPLQLLALTAAAATLLTVVATGETTAAPPAAHASVQVVPIGAEQLRAELSALRGRIVIVNLWATWCVPCLREVPTLLQLAADLEPQGVTLLGVAMDDPSDLGRVRAFHGKYFPAFRTWQRTGNDMDSVASVIDPAWNEVLPTTYLIGRDGKMTSRLQGARSYAEFRASVEALDR